MCDPLLAGRTNSSIMKKYPKLLDRKTKSKLGLQETDRTVRHNIDQAYEIPAELLEMKHNYNLINQHSTKPVTTGKIKPKSMAVAETIKPVP